MALTSGEIPNLVSGVSQQASSIRLPTQCELQKNFDPTIVRGLKKRPPTQHIAKIMSTVPAAPFFHIINRDVSERYAMAVSNDRVRVYDLSTGAEKTVNAPNGWGYLAGITEPLKNTRAVTVADYTFIVNKQRTVQASSDVFPTRPAEALVYVVLGNYSRSYKITIDGSVVAEYATPGAGLSGSAIAVDTSWIAQILMNGTAAAGNAGGLVSGPSGGEGQEIFGSTSNAQELIDNKGKVIRHMDARGINGSNGWFLTRYQSAIHITKTSGSFSIAVEDGYNGTAMRVSKGTVQSFTDLPTFGPEGYVVEVANTGESASDNYWVRAEKAASGDSSVIWRETAKPGTRIGLDASTMPHVLVREADGTFTFRPAAWDNRKCGDGDKISPDPSFVGKRIEDVFFHRNRLGFLADENVVMSRAGSFFDFYRTTATAVLDDDPIDVAAAHVKVSLLKHAVPHQDDLLVFSENSQFRLAGNDLLTPKTVSLRPLTEFPCARTVKPVASGKSTLFVSDSEAGREWAAVYEFYLDKALETADASNIASHVPSYIPSGVRHLIGSSDQDLIVINSEGAPDTLFVYRYLWSGDEKLQAAWCEWAIPEADVLAIGVIEAELVLVLGRSDGVYLERMRVEPDAVDSAYGFQVALDRRVSSSSLPAPSYNSGADTTTYTLPYPAAASINAVVPPGLSKRVVATAGNTVTLRGDTRALSIFFGFPFVSRYRFSDIHMRRTGAGGSTVTLVNGRLQLHHLTVAYDTSGYFRIEVTPESRDTYTYPFLGRIFGDPNNILGAAAVDTGRINVPVMSRSDRVVMDLVNDTWAPSNFTSAAWRGNWNDRPRQT